MLIPVRAKYTIGKQWRRTQYVNRNKNEPRGVARQGLKRSATARRKKFKRGK